MSYDDKYTAAAHMLTLENREKMNIGGVTDVSGFDENTVLLCTDLGELMIKGEGLHIDRIDLDAGRLELRGRVCELRYDEPPAARGLWSRLFG